MKLLNKFISKTYLLKKLMELKNIAILLIVGMMS